MMGTNPAIVRDGPHKGLQILADEENLGRELAKSLSAEQRPKAVLSERRRRTLSRAIIARYRRSSRPASVGRN